jgi:hypothetical protein
MNHQTTLEKVRFLSQKHNMTEEQKRKKRPKRYIAGPAERMGWTATAYVVWLIDPINRNDRKYLVQRENNWSLIVGGAGAQKETCLRTPSLYQAQRLRDSILAQKEAA